MREITAMITIPTLTNYVKFSITWHVIPYARPTDVGDTGKSLASQYTIKDAEPNGICDCE